MLRFSAAALAASALLAPQAQALTLGVGGQTGAMTQSGAFSLLPDLTDWTAAPSVMIDQSPVLRTGPDAESGVSGNQAVWDVEVWRDDGAGGVEYIAPRTSFVTEFSDGAGGGGPLGTETFSSTAAPSRDMRVRIQDGVSVAALLSDLSASGVATDIPLADGSGNLDSTSNVDVVEFELEFFIASDQEPGSASALGLYLFLLFDDGLVDYDGLSGSTPPLLPDFEEGLLQAGAVQLDEYLLDGSGTPDPEQVEARAFGFLTDVSAVSYGDETSAVPVPAALPLLGGALAALGLMGRRRRG